MEKYLKIRLYLIGMMIGMIGEYLYRVKLDIIPLIIFILLIVFCLIDIYNDRNI